MRPSGETVGVLISTTFSGISMVKLICLLSMLRGQKYRTARVVHAIKSTAATVHAIRSCRFRFEVGIVDRSVDSELVDGAESASIAKARSRAELKRSSGFFSRQ